MMSITAEHPVIRWEKDLVEFKILVDTYMYTGEVHTCSMDISHAIIRCEFCNKPYATLEEKEAFLKKVDEFRKDALLYHPDIISTINRISVKSDDAFFLF